MSHWSKELMPQVNFDSLAYYLDPPMATITSDIDYLLPILKYSETCYSLNNRGTLYP